ncbi:MAG: polyprenol monophosphomannose synthase [Candidatus Aenigmatarchaeota archaeon]
MLFSLVIPTYNERENIGLLIKDLNHVFRKNSIKAEIIIVDDNSPDNTGKLCKGLAKKQKNLVVIERSGKLGLSSAVIAGFGAAKGDVLGVMDADFSHPVQTLPRMVAEIKKGADVVIGSRYVRGGGIEGWPIIRRITSLGATTMALPLTSVRDPMSGFFVLRRGVIKGVSLDPIGYKIGLEIIVKGRYKKIVEVPYVFMNRKAGKTKLNAREYTNYLRHVFSLLLYKFIKLNKTGA